jgi:arsenite-transporting ATPase
VNNVFFPHAAGAASLPTDRLSLQQENLVGVTALRRLLTGENPCSLPAAKPVSEPLSAPSLEMLIDDIARGGHGLVMLMGKGGVGKTTLPPLWRPR